MLAFAATEAGRRHMWLRPIDSLTAQAVPGTEDATYLFWSPDSANIAFFVPGKLKKSRWPVGPSKPFSVTLPRVAAVCGTAMA